MDSKNNKDNSIKVALISAAAIIIVALIPIVFSKSSEKESVSNFQNSTQVNTQGGDFIQNNQVTINQENTNTQKIKNDNDKKSPLKKEDSQNLISDNNTIEIPIQLNEKTKGYNKIYLNDKEAVPAKMSTPLNPRLLIQINKLKEQTIIIVTNSNDTCKIKYLFNSKNIDNYPVRLIPNCN